MAETTGFVYRLTIKPSLLAEGNILPIAMAEVGERPNNADLLVLRWDSSDPENVRAMKSSIVDGLNAALLGRRRVSVGHGDDSLILTLNVE
jgi:hypothetical protein